MPEDVVAKFAVSGHEHVYVATGVAFLPIEGIRYESVKVEGETYQRRLADFSIRETGEHYVDGVYLNDYILFR